jgi:hypothetical protein
VLPRAADGAGEGAIGAAATSSTQHAGTGAGAGATLGVAGFDSGSAANGWTSAPTAKNTAAGAMTAARATDGFRRSLANECLPTDSRLRGNGRKCHEVVTAGSQNGYRACRTVTRRSMHFRRSAAIGTRTGAR